MNPDEALRLNQITEDSELLKSTLLLVIRLKEIQSDRSRNANDFIPTIHLLADMARDIAERLQQWPSVATPTDPYGHG